MDLDKLVIIAEMIDYVLAKYGNKWQVDNVIPDVILDDLLHKEFNNQERIKDDKGKGLLRDDKGNGLLKYDKGKLTRIKCVDLEKRIQNVEEVPYKAKKEMLMKKEVIIIDSDTSSDDTHLSSSSKPYKAKWRSSSKDLQADVGGSAWSFTLLVPNKKSHPIRNCILCLLVNLFAQCFCILHMALLLLCENGNSFTPVPRITTNADGTSTSTISGPVTAEEKAQKKNDVKARSMMLMALPNEHLLTFSQYKDAKTLFEARQKIVSQLAILGENISQEDVNMKFLRSLPAEWNTHVIVWRNKPDLEKMCFDDFYNNFKIVEQEVKRTVVSSSSSGSPNMAFLSSPSSTNEVDTASIQVSAANTPVSTVSSPNNTANLSDATVYAFLANQPNGSQLVHEDLKQIHKDDLEEMDLKWQLALLSMRARSSGLEEFKQPKFESYGPKANKSVCVDTSNVIKKVFDAPIIEDWISDCDEDESEEVMIQKPVLKTVEKGSVVLTKSEIVPISTARQSSSRIAALVSTARPINTVAPKPIVNVAKTRQNAFQKTHSLSRRPFHQQTTLKNKYLVNTAKVKSVNTAKGKSVTSAIGKQGSNAVKSSACWVWRHKIKDSSPFSQIIKNMMEDLLLLQAVLKEMCDKKNSVLFTETECLILSPDFKLLDENQVLLKVPRKNNMYSFDVKNVVPSKGLTCLFAKATNDESNLWHRRLGHINFKTMNKLVKRNLVRGLPLKIFENDHTCVACQKGKQDKASFSAGNRTNGIAGSKIHSDVGQEGKEKLSDQEYILLPGLNTSSDVPSSNEEVVSSPKDDARKKSIIEPTYVEGGKIDDLGCLDQQIKSTDDSKNTNSTNNFNAVSLTVNTASDKDGTFQRTYGEWNFSTPIPVNATGSSFSHPTTLDDFSKMPNLEDIGIFDDAYDDRDEGAEADYNNLEIVIPVNPIPSTRIHKDHPKEQIVREMEPKKVTQALNDESWVKAMQEELLQFKLLNVWTLVDLPHRKRAIGTKWVYKNKRDQRGIVVRNKARLVAQGHRQKEGINYNEVFPPIARIKAIRPEIMFAVYACSRFQVQQKVSHMHTMDNESAICVVKNPVYHSKTKHIEIRNHFIKDSYEKWLIEMVNIHTDSNVANLLTKAFDVTSSKAVNSVKQIHAVVDGKAVVISESLVRSDLLFDDEDVNQEEGDRVEKAITTDASLEAAQDSDNITKTQTMAMPNVDIPQRIDTRDRPRHQETMGGTSSQTRSERVLKQPNEPPLTEGHTSGSREESLEENIKLMETIPTPYDSPLPGGYIPRSDEGRITLAGLMETCIILSNRVTQLETELSTTKDVYNKAFITLTNRVKKLESQLKQKRSRAIIFSLDEEGPSVQIEDSPKQGRIIEEMEKDENINLVSEQGEVQETGEHSRDDDGTLEETLLNVKKSSAKDKGKGIMQETELP
nr:ribonuclease H-like domain-containing protein [Tanacetum cinerariifolium]